MDAYHWRSTEASRMYRTAPIRASCGDRAAAASDHAFCRLGRTVKDLGGLVYFLLVVGSADAA